MSQPLIDGATITLGRRAFVVPPLNLGRIKKLQDDLAILAMVPQDATRFEPHQLEAAITIIHSALTRNYPDLTREEVEDVVDMGNMENLMRAIMGQSGFAKGEARPVTEVHSTGTASTPT